MISISLYMCNYTCITVQKLYRLQTSVPKFTLNANLKKDYILNNLLFLIYINFERGQGLEEITMTKPASLPRKLANPQSTHIYPVAVIP